MATIAVLGTGLLGSGFASNLIDQGHTVRVWNRTASKCAPLVAAGATQGLDPADTVRGAVRVHLILSADDAVDAVISALRPGLADGVPILDHSTNLPARVAIRFHALRAEGVRYLHLPVFMGPRNAAEGTGLMLTCGPEEELQALAPALQTMTGTLLPLGPDPAKAAAIKLTGNGMLVMLTAAMGDLFSMGRAAGVTPDEVVALFRQFAPTAAGMGQRVLASGDGPPSFELTMARKDTALMIETAGDEPLVLLPAIAQAMDRAIAAGRGDEDFAAFVRPRDCCR